MQRALTAPGKLFLSGEYAVLWGGVARIAAVAPRTAALVRRRSDREVHLVLPHARLVGNATPAGVNWGPAGVPEEFRFAARCLDLAFRAHGVETLGLELALAPSPLGPGGQKLGQGGSARSCVLASEAARYVLEGRYDALKLALVAHADAQGGKGSGGDVAACFAGGIIRYRRYDTEALRRASTGGQLSAALVGAAPVDVWRLPSRPFHLAYAFTGASASTPDLIERAEAAVGEDQRAELVRESDELGALLEASLLGDRFDGVREATSGLREVLARIGKLETDEARRILAIVESYGCAGKVSGAGGGDGCVLFAPDEKTLRELLAGLAARGFTAVELEVEAGLRGEASPEPGLERWLEA